jgi:hypothetical protein
VRALPSELEAILHIFSHDDELRTKALPHVDIEGRRVHWRPIFAEHYGSGHYAALLWACALWRDAPPSELENLFVAAFSMDAGLRRTVLRAIAIRWSIPIDGLRTLRSA